jgi:hypothetical protein
MSDDYVTLKIPRIEAEQLIDMLSNYIDHYTEDGHYNGEPEVVSLMNRLIIETEEVDYSADDFYAGGAE